MGYHGDRLAPLFTPELAESAAHDMAVTGTTWLHGRIVFYTPVAEEFGGGGGRWASVNRERGRDPGTMKRAWYRDPEGIRRRSRGADHVYEGRVLTDDEAVKFVEDDTRPHIIRPKNGKALRFRIWPSGRVAYARSVRHPGTTGVHMVARSEAEARAEFPHIVDDQLQQWARAQARHCAQENRAHPVHIGQNMIGAA